MGALINGVFLVALCLSIFLEAIQRFVEPQEVSSPVIILIVGCAGLLANLAGLALFHDHGHSHGESEHAHTKGDKLSAAEDGRASATQDTETHAIADENGNILDALPENFVENWSKAKAPTHSNKGNRRDEHKFKKVDDDSSTAVESGSPRSSRNTISIGSPRDQRHRTSTSHSRHTSLPELHIHPASFRNGIISSAGRLDDIQDSPTSESAGDVSPETEPSTPTEDSPLLVKKRKPSNAGRGRKGSQDIGHSSHKHRQSKNGPEISSHGHGHSHGDLNMRALFLHVMGDALGNIGVIATALFIWLTPFWWRFYCDPMISLVITVIILCSALPLCRATANILLQAVPKHISVADIKADIEDLPSIVSCHHLHVWQLSDTKLVASLHVQIAFAFEGDGPAEYTKNGSKRYMRLAKAIRTCLHEYGIHSSTIQPEFCLDADHHHIKESYLNGDGVDSSTDTGTDGAGSMAQNSRKPSINNGPDGCLLDCDDDCDGGGCCEPVK